MNKDAISIRSGIEELGIFEFLEAEGKEKYFIPNFRISKKTFLKYFQGSWSILEKKDVR